MMNGGPISWKSRRQDSVALSTSDAEYMVVSEVVKEILYLRSILHDVGYAQTAPTDIGKPHTLLHRPSYGDKGTYRPGKTSLNLAWKN